MVLRHTQCVYVCAHVSLHLRSYTVCVGLCANLYTYDHSQITMCVCEFLASCPLLDTRRFEGFTYLMCDRWLLSFLRSNRLIILYHQIPVHTCTPVHGTCTQYLVHTCTQYLCIPVHLYTCAYLCVPVRTPTKKVQSSHSLLRIDMHG